MIRTMASTEAEKNAIFQNESVENADAIVRDILASRVERTTEDGKEVSDVVLQYGRKDMTITFRHGIRLSGGLLVNMYLENARGEAFAKKHETTLLYMAAKNVLEELANKSGQPVAYVFDTESKALYEWARTQGEGLFHWDKKESDPDKPGHSVFTKIFKPEQL